MNQTSRRVSDAKAPCPLDSVNRHFRTERPNQRWVPVFTCVSIHHSHQLTEAGVEPIGYIPPVEAEANYSGSSPVKSPWWQPDLTPTAPTNPGAVQ